MKSEHAVQKNQELTPTPSAYTLSKSCTLLTTK